MIEIRRILCPIDFSDYSRHALDHAVAIARCYGSTIALLNVYATAPVPVHAAGSLMHRAAAVLTPGDRGALLTAMKGFAEQEVGSGIPIDFDLSEGPVAAEILDRAKTMPADLLVMGTHGRSGFERLMLGSIAEKVLRKAACPVLTVPPRAADVVPVPPVLFKHIVCATDFSDCATHALDYAMSLAQEADARLTVLHVLEVPEDLTPDLYETAHDGEPTLASYVKAANRDRRERLQAAVPETVRTYCTVESVMATGKPYREILRVAGEQPTDLIVMGIRGRRAADLLFVGSTTHHVVREARCPVLTLRWG